MKANFKSGLIYMALISIIFFSGCNPDDIVEKKFEIGTVIDLENNIYKTVKIGDQVWMQDDLIATKFRNGENIKLISDENEWQNATFPAYTVGKTGLLYNFYAVKSSANIAPIGWHVASDAEWQKMESTLGMNQSELGKNKWRGVNVGDKLKEDYQVVPATWTNFDNVWGTNDSGFKALACGCRVLDGRFCEPSNREQGFWWTSTQTENEAWYRNLDYKRTEVFRYFAHQNYGFAIRCVKD